MKERIKVEPQNRNKTFEKISINWAFPEISEKDVALAAGHFMGYEGSPGDQINKIRDAIERCEVRHLDEKTWSMLENTDSFGIRFGDVEGAVQNAVDEGEDAKEVEKLIQYMKDGLPIPSPVLIFKKDGAPYLISGNTRLMLARVFGATPQVVIARMK